MKFAETKIPGTFLVTQERHTDERGFFARVWCHDELARHGLDHRLSQSSLSHNPKRGTLRGLHVQNAPAAENKLVTCARGALFDVALDLRPLSPAYLDWFGVELTWDNGVMLYIPEGVAHGFLTLADDTAVLYHISQDHRPELSTGVRWDDPAFAIDWPFPPVVMSARDRSHAAYVPQRPAW